MKPRPAAERFWDRVSVEEDGCWLWLGAMLKTGYGQIEVDGKTRSTHRLSYELNCGPIPPGQVVRHCCDVRRCVNPDHLVLGTQADNVHDMWSRGRARSPQPRLGESNPAAKLSEQDVRSIRAARSSGVLLREIAAAHGVTRALAGMVVSGKVWGHVQ